MNPGESFDSEVEGGVSEALQAVREVAGAWGGLVHGERPDGVSTVEIPVVAGLRRGRLRARFWAAGADSHTTVHLEVDDLELHLNVSAVAILLLSASGGLASVLWPWFPSLLPAVPLGLVLAVGGWLLVAGRLRSSGVEEFLQALRSHCAEAASDRMDPEGGNADA